MKSAVGIALVCVLGALTGLVLVWLEDGSLLPNDCAQYLSVAKHVQAGDGLLTDLVFFEEHLGQSAMPAAETGFAPGYPLLIAAVAAMGLEPLEAAFAVNVVSFVLIPLLLYFLLQSSTDSVLIAVSMSAVWLAVLMGWYSAWEKLSELPFVVCTLLATLSLPSGNEGGRWRWGLAGVGAAAAVALRYAGVSFVAAVGVVLVGEWAFHRGSRPRGTLLAFAAAPTAVMTAIVVRNVQVAGSPLGGNEQFQVTSITEVLGRFAKALQHLSGFTRQGFEGLQLPELVFLLVVISVCVLWYWQRASLTLDREWMATRSADRRVRVARVYVVTALVLLLWIDLRSAVTLQARMLLVLVPFVLLQLGVFVSAVRIVTPQARRWSHLMVLVLAITFLIGQSRVIAWQQGRPNHYALVQEALATPVAGDAATDWLRARNSVKHPLLGNEPQMLGAVVQGPVVGLPSPPYSARSWSDAEVQRLVVAYDIEIVVLMPELLRVTSEQVDFFERLARGEWPRWLIPVQRDERLQIYRVAVS